MSGAVVLGVCRPMEGMHMKTIDTAVRAEAADHLLKAVIALMAVRDPEFLRHLDRIFALADAHDSQISRMRPEVWAEVRREIGVIHDFVQGEDAPSGVPQKEIKIAH